MTAGELGAASHCREQSAAEEHLASQSVHLCGFQSRHRRYARGGAGPPFSPHQFRRVASETFLSRHSFLATAEREGWRLSSAMSISTLLIGGASGSPR